MHISSACEPRQEGHFRVDLSLRRRMRGLRRGKAPFAGIWLRQTPCLKRLLSRRRQGKAPPSVLRAARSCAASDKCFRKRACCPRVGHGFCADNAKSLVQSARTAHRAGAHTALFTLFTKKFCKQIFFVSAAVLSFRSALLAAADGTRPTRGQHARLRKHLSDASYGRAARSRAKGSM